MSVCQSCGGVIGRDCFNPQECMAITRDMADRYSTAENESHGLRAENDHLKQRIAAMNEVFVEIRKTIGGNTFSQELHPEDFDPESPWLPVGLMMRIDGVMEREYRA